MATSIDYILAEDREDYNAIIGRAAEAKANAPKIPTIRKPISDERKIKMTENRLEKLMAKLAALRADNG